MSEQYHIHKSFPTKPFQRYACTLEQANTPLGFRVVDADPDVADVAFLEKLSDHMSRAQMIQDSEVTELGIIEKPPQIAHGPSPRHFENAVRTIPGAYLSAHGR
jgi:hypothetical protein